MKMMFSGGKEFMRKHFEKVFMQAVGVHVSKVSTDSEDIYGNELLEVEVEGDEEALKKVSDEINKVDTDGEYGGAIVI